MSDNTTISRAYYTNSLKAWRNEMRHELRGLMARYASMERAHHPDKQDHGRLIELMQEFIARLDKELADATA